MLVIKMLTITMKINLLQIFFEKVFLNAGESKEVTLVLNPGDFAYWHPDSREWTIESGEFENNFNNIEFNFSVPQYDKYLDTEYQYQLEGIENHWSRWTKSSTATFPYLPFGNYVFKVRAKVGNTLSTNLATYNFKIQRPLLLSNVFIGIYLICLWLFSLLVHNLYVLFSN